MSTKLAWSATHRYCRNLGYASGVGPLEHSPTELLLGCLPSEIAEVVIFSSEQVGAYGCFESDVNSYVCTIAIWALCYEMGWEYGHGPVEWNSAVMHGICIADP